jgi:hypothetical protein
MHYVSEEQYAGLADAGGYYVREISPQEAARVIGSALYKHTSSRK